MPRLLVICGAALAVLTSFAAVRADDAQIAQQITAQLRQQQKTRNLHDFKIGVQVNQGTVTMMGEVPNSEQGQLALDLARRVPGVRLVVNDLQVRDAGVAPVSAAVPMARPAYRPMPAPAALAQPARIATATRPAAAMPSAVRPVAFAPSQIPTQLASNVVSGDEYANSSPVPATMPTPMGGGAGVQQAMYDNPQMPGYAWPSYASYPNYGAVSYPKQYSPTAWPYIGPFYPYPQVPLGWRKVMLEWDDGWWWLDFKAK